MAPRRSSASRPRRGRYDTLILEAFQRLPLGSSIDHSEWHSAAEVVWKITHSVLGVPTDRKFGERITKRLSALVALGVLKRWTNATTGEITFKYSPDLGKKLYAKRRMPSKSHEWI